VLVGESADDDAVDAQDGAGHDEHVGVQGDRPHVSR